MPLYTFFLDYQNGTYVSQVRAPNVRRAPKVWARSFDYTVVPGLGAKTAGQLAQELDEPVALTGIKQTWCCTALLRGHLALIHFVQTID